MLYKFIIEKYNPENLPLDLFCDAVNYLKELLGNSAHIHFDEVEEGCSALCVRIEESAEKEVLESEEKFKKNADKINKANQFLKKYNTYGRIEKFNNPINDNVEVKPNIVLEFEGARKENSGFVGKVKDNANIDGFLIGISGKTDKKCLQIKLESGEVKNANCSKEVALSIKENLMENRLLRFECEANRRRDDEGKWHLEDLVVKSHFELENRSLEDTLMSLNKKEYFDWYKEKDPFSILEEIRS